MSLVESDDPALVVLPPASGLAERRRARREVARRRRRRRIAVAVTLVWVALVGWSLLSARSAASTATADARAVAADFAGADAAELQEVVGDLDRVVSRLNDPWVYPLRLVPWVGRQVIVTDDLAVAARDAVGAGVVALESVDQASLDDPIGALTTASTALGDALSTLDQIEVPDGRWLAGPVADARIELLDALGDVTAEVDRYEALATGLADMASGESTYLIAAANTSEMGSASGMLLQYGTMTIDDGAVLVSDFSPVGSLGRPSRVPIDDGIRTLWFSLDPGHLWQYTSHLSARGSSVGAISGAMWQSDSGVAVDGTLIIDPVAMQLLLDAAGVDSVSVDGEALPTDEIADFFGVEQYRAVDDSGELVTADTLERRSAIAPVAAAALRAVFSSEADPRALVTGLYGAFDQRHLMFWSAEPSLQAKWERAGASGDPVGNAVKVAALNAGGNKLDYYLDIDVDIATEAQRAVLTISATNTARLDEVSYVLGSRRPGHYSGHLVISVPSSSLAVESYGTTSLNASANDGATHSFVHIIDLEAGESAEWTVEIDLPPAMTELTLEPSGRYPGIDWTIDGRAVADTRQTFELSSD